MVLDEGTLAPLGGVSSTPLQCEVSGGACAGGACTGRACTGRACAGRACADRVCAGGACAGLCGRPRLVGDGKRRVGWVGGQWEVHECCGSGEECVPCCSQSLPPQPPHHHALISIHSSPPTPPSPHPHPIIPTLPPTLPRQGLGWRFAVTATARQRGWRRGWQQGWQRGWQ